MQKAFDFLDKYLMGPMGKLSTFQFVRAIMAAGMASIPFTIVGSAFLILGILPLAFPVLTDIWAISFDRVTNLYMVANTFTMGSLAIYFNIVMGYELTRIKAQESGLDLAPINGALLSLMAFLFTMVQLEFKEGQFLFMEGDNMINGVAYGGFVNRMGSSGIFIGIVMATLAVWLYQFCVSKGWTIKLPENVPSGVSKSFTALVPAFAITFTILIVNAALIALGYDIYTIIELPFGFVKSILNTWWGLVIIQILVHALWSVGIHGSSIIGSLYTPFALANLETNQKLLLEGARTGFQVFAGEFQTMFVFFGGSGGTLGLCLFMLFLAKSEQMKIIGKAGIAPSIFGINEPILFGLPIMYNPNLIIPFILAPSVTAVLAYFGIASGIFPPIIANVPWPTPMAINAFLGTGSLMGSVLSVILFGVNFAIYWPFMKKYDSQLYKEEQAAVNEEILITQTV